MRFIYFKHNISPAWHVAPLVLGQTLIMGNKAIKFSITHDLIGISATLCDCLASGCLEMDSQEFARLSPVAVEVLGQVSAKKLFKTPSS